MTGVTDMTGLYYVKNVNVICLPMEHQRAVGARF